MCVLLTKHDVARRPPAFIMHSHVCTVVHQCTCRQTPQAVSSNTNLHAVQTPLH
jgi:hypothetical protein